MGSLQIHKQYKSMFQFSREGLSDDGEVIRKLIPSQVEDYIIVIEAAHASPSDLPMSLRRRSKYDKLAIGFNNSYLTVVTVCVPLVGFECPWDILEVEHYQEQDRVSFYIE